MKIVLPYSDERWIKLFNEWMDEVDNTKFNERLDMYGLEWGYYRTNESGDKELIDFTIAFPEQATIKQKHEFYQYLIGENNS